MVLTVTRMEEQTLGRGQACGPDTNNRDGKVCLSTPKMSGSNFKIRVFIELINLEVRPLV